jgi:hypothetical protein
MSSSDSPLRHSNAHSFAADSGIYRWLSSENVVESAIGDAMRNMISFWYVGAFVQPSPDQVPSAQNDKTLNEQIIGSVADRIVEIFVPAYDHESFLIWRL